ncbi:unnamed protein product [Bursaphelenchus xylophilus]|uniref:(pine wood nematode) hypothetical protein n=1 Tax=Bursaphelenchus xylophilus TaxID=6326 RepID=A0A1I7S9D7_BURXY|nr:unnamed protein product [Bursaphelenchus xylophilus]CAG9100547.1 unnamed protein product [Bursaphelenchus xylophilus]
MNLLSLVATILLVNCGDGYVDNFYLSAAFFDNINISRNLMLDISSAETFVLDANSFPNVGKNNSFDATKSITFHRTVNFSTTYSNLTNDEEFTVSGYKGDDFVDLPFRVEAEFSVATGIRGDALKSNGNDQYAGRIGFSKGKSLIREKLFEKASSKMICFFLTTLLEEQKIGFKLVTWFKLYNSTTLTVNTSAEANSENLWQVPVTSLEIGKFKSNFKAIAVLSTTLSGITVPERFLAPIVRALNGQWDAEKNYYKVDCSAKLPLTIGVAGKPVEIGFNGYVETVDFKKPECRLRIRSHKRDLFVLGLPLYVNRGACIDFATDTVALFRR